MKVQTATGKEFLVAWFNLRVESNELHLELIKVDPATVFSVFSNPKETKVLTCYIDASPETYNGYVKPVAIFVKPDGTTYVSLSK